MYTVCVVTGTRADYGLLRELLLKLDQDEMFKLNLVVTGSHLVQGFGNTQDEIRADGFTSYETIELSLDDDSKLGMAHSTGEALVAFSDYFSKKRPDLLIVLGDRYEVFAAASAAMLMGIEVAHISGGDVTEGAIDDAIRHCITKMSSIHFAGCEQSAKRIVQLGELPENVFNVGEPGVENCLKTKFLTEKELSEQLNFDIAEGNYAVVTFHPVTRENDTADMQLTELIAAMDSLEMKYIITLANADAGGREINERWKKEGEKRKNWLVVASLGIKRYLSVMRNANFVLGNSSSGIVEAPAFGVPTINVGDRQKGRMFAESVLSCAPERAEIIEAMKKALEPEFQEKAKNVVSPFGNGTTSEKIVEQLKNYLSNSEKNTKKAFFDIDFELGE